MIFWNRLKNIWAWSAYKPSNPPKEMGFEWTNFVTPTIQQESKTLAKGQFIPRIIKDPAKAITEEQP